MTTTAAKSDAISGVEMVPLSTLAMTVPMPPLTTVPAMGVASLSTLATKDVVASMEAQSNAATSTSAANATAVAAVQSEADATTTSVTKSVSQSTASPPPSSSWRAMFVTLFAMITPEWAGEHEVENDFLDDLRVKSVPPHISDVFNGKNNDLFWRYDMDSYAANRHNEDRSQYIEDVLEDDATGAETPVFFCACYDGHGGEQAVDFVQANLYNNIKARLQTGTESIALCIINGFKGTDEEFHRRSQSKFKKGEWTACSVGACAVIALMVGKKLYVAGCGDCRAIMAFRDPTGALCVEQITSDHSANEEHEQRRLRVLHPDDYDIVREIGARNYYVKGRLQPTRSIGDTYMKVKDVNKAPMPRGLRIHGSFKRPYITAVPDVFEVDLQNRRPEFLVLGSDGLYGEMSNQEIVDMVAKFRDEGEANVSMALRTAVLERVSQYYGFSVSDLEDICPGERRNYHDDITIDVLHFAPPHSESKTASRAAAA
uniref:protein-serine/threonine phosphatase n=1 Tax=Globisporangium ultimum (strain ATCC 200006 / CBS 805.95 / DAOM BR144) TaxID=431595 RepID=K3XAU4_GLOUD